MHTRRAAPLNSLALSTGALSQTQPARLNTPARSSALHSHATTISPTRRSHRNQSEGVSAVLGGSLGASVSPTRPGTRGRAAEPASQRVSTATGGVRGAAQADGLSFTTPAYSHTTLTSGAKTANRALRLAHGMGMTQGPRPTMEDAHSAHPNYKEINGVPLSFYAILDGHCGRRVADLGAQFLPDLIATHPETGRKIASALVDSIIRTDYKIFQQIHRQDGGSTLICAAIYGNTLTVACVGDARAVLCDSNRAVPMSIDHKPTDPGEQQRITRCGGMVHFGRVGGCLAVSRALGDFEFKFNGQRYIHREYQVSNVADIREINISDSTQFLILACDGLWDVMSNEEAVFWVNDYIMRTLEKQPTSANVDRARILNQCSQQLAETAVAKGSMDNVSVIVIAFHDWIKGQQHA